MPLIDPQSLVTGPPRSRDGREYPEHLKPYEAYDGHLLHLLSAIQPATFDQLSVKVQDPKIRSILVRWLASAEWRGLIERRGPTRMRPRSYVLSELGTQQLQAA